MGFGNILRTELAGWWHTRKWWITGLVFLVLVTGIVTLVTFTSDLDQSQLVDVFCSLLFLFSAVGIVITVQGAVIGEKRSGTAEWVLSKPVSRTAFILPKFIANAVGFLVVVIGMQGLCCYLVISLGEGNWISLPGYIAGLALISLNLMFYLALTLMLGTFFNNRAAVVGIPIVFLLAESFLEKVPVLREVLPGLLVGNAGSGNLAQAYMNGKTAGSLLPIFTTAFLIALFMAAAVWRFKRQEF